MTEIQQKLPSYEEVFGHRFSSEDHEYQEYVQRAVDPPPTVDDWRGRGGGNQRGRDGRMPEIQQKLQSYEEMFGHRFSSEDHEYQEYVQRAEDLPPTVDDWRGRGGGNQRGRDGRYQGSRGPGWGWGGRGQGSGEGMGWRGEHRGQQWQDRDRSWGHSSGSGAPGSYQGSNPHHQRSYHHHHH